MNEILIYFIGYFIGGVFGYFIGTKIGEYKTKKFYNGLNCIKSLMEGKY